MRIFYISGYPLAGNQSPSINERDFALELEVRFPGECFYYLCEGGLEVDLPRDRVVFYQAPPPLWHPRRFLAHALRWRREARDLVLRHRPDLIVIRPFMAPLKEWMLARGFPGKVVAKNSERYWITGPRLNWIEPFFRKVHGWLYERFYDACVSIECVRLFLKSSPVVRTDIILHYSSDVRVPHSIT